MKPPQHAELAEAAVTAQASTLLNRMAALLDGADTQVVLTAAVALLIEAIQHRHPGSVIRQLAALSGVGRAAANQINAANFQTNFNTSFQQTPTETLQ